jgi:hypothetical protein
MAIAGEILEQGVKAGFKALTKKGGGSAARKAVTSAPLSFLDFRSSFKKQGKWPKFSPQHETMLERQWTETKGSDAVGMGDMIERMNAPEGDPIREAAYGQFNDYANNVGGFQEAADKGERLVRQYNSRNAPTELKQEIGQRLIENPTFEPRQDLFYIMDAAGDAKRVSGTDKLLKNYQETGEINPKLLTFKSKSKTKATKSKRAEIMRVPKKETTAEFHRRYPNDPERAERMAREYNSTRMSGYMITAEAARKQGLTTREWLTEVRTGKRKILSQAEKNKRTTYASGHIHAANAPDNPLKPRPSDSPLYNPATEGNTTRIEEALENISGSNKIKHDINPFAAEKAGIPYNWMESIDMFIDRYSSTSPHKMPMWQRDFTVDELDVIFNIPGDADEETVERIFLALMDARKNPKHRRQNYIQEVQAIAKELGGEGDPLTGKTDFAPPNLEDMYSRGLERPN